MASGVTPLAARMRVAPPVFSWAMAMSRCSVETYSSFSRCASSHARLITPSKRGVAYVRPPPCTFGSFVISACTWADTVSGRAPSLASSGLTTPSCCWSKASSRCSGSIAWWSCWSASDWAACTASCAFTVSLSSLISSFPSSVF